MRVKYADGRVVCAARNETRRRSKPQWRYLCWRAGRRRTASKCRAKYRLEPETWPPGVHRRGASMTHAGEPERYGGKDCRVSDASSLAVRRGGLEQARPLFGPVAWLRSAALSAGCQGSYKTTVHSSQQSYLPIDHDQMSGAGQQACSSMTAWVVPFRRIARSSRELAASRPARADGERR